MKITLTHSGKQHAYHVANALMKLGYLDRFITSSYITNLALQRWLLKQGNTFFTRRFQLGLGSPFVESNWRFEIKETLLRKKYGKSPKVQKAVYHRDVAFDHYVANRLPRLPADSFWGFQGSCLESLKSANELGRLSICELATAHVTGAKKILGEEAKLQPHWADSFDNLVFPADYEKRLETEPHVAQLVIAASEFTRQTLIDDSVSSSKIHKLHLGFDTSHIPYSENAKPISNRPLRLLYAGTVTQRKGISYLLEAMQDFSTHDVELHIIGGIQGSGNAFWQHKNLFQYHPPVSQFEMFKAYSHYDALVLPTIFEGFGLVIIEAMAAGLPVMATPHSIGPEIIQHNSDGWIIPIRNSYAIKDVIHSLRNLPDDQYFNMRLNARKKALSFTWEAYQKNLQKLIEEQFEIK